MPSRKERIKVQNKTEILDAAERIFIRMGYHLATMELIAQEAEFAVGTLYNFFKNKQELYDEVMERVGNDFLDQLETKVLPYQDAQKALAALIDLILHQFQTYHGLLRDYVNMQPLNQIDPYGRMSNKCHEFYDKIIYCISRIFEKGIHEGVFAQEDPVILAVAFDGMVNSLMFHWSSQDLPPDPAKQRKVLLHLASRLVRPKHDPLA